MHLIKATEPFRSYAERVCLEGEEFTVNLENLRALPKDRLLQQDVKVVVSTFYKDKTIVSKTQRS